MPEPQIRPATLADTESLLEMMEDFNTLERIPWSRGSALPALQQLLATATLGAVVLVFEGASPCGYFVLTWGFDLEWSGRDAFLTELYLRPDARGRGLGGAVLACAERFAREHAAGALHLMVRPENTAAVRLYRGAGYEAPPRIFLSKVLERGRSSRSDHS